MKQNDPSIDHTKPASERASRCITLTRPFRILGHRGACGYAPENTFPSFDLACQLGAETIETDLHLTRDGIIVLMHDKSVDRTTDGTGLIAEKTWDEMRSLRIRDGEGFAPDSVRVPRLEEFLDRYLHQVSLCLEIKAHAVVEPLVKIMRAMHATHREDRVELTTFEWDLAEKLHGTIPEIPIGMLVHDFEPATIEKVAAAGFAQICTSAKSLTHEGVAAARKHGMNVRAYGIKTLDDLQRAIDFGADGTTINWPDWARRPDDVPSFTDRARNRSRCNV